MVAGEPAKRPKLGKCDIRHGFLRLIVGAQSAASQSAQNRGTVVKKKRSDSAALLR